MSDFKPKRLEFANGTFFVNRKKTFSPSVYRNPRVVDKCFNFAWSMTYGGIGEHRSNRSGGTSSRKNGEIFANTFQGKMAEFAMFEIFENLEGVKYPDLSLHPLGKWDTCDIVIGNYKIAVKSTKSFGNLLLLEASDWSMEADYLNNPKTESPDMFALVRIAPEVEKLMRSGRLLYSSTCERENLYSIVVTQHDYKFDICGFASRDDIKMAIKLDQRLEKGSKLNGTTTMDANNFYIQAGDLRTLDSMIKQFPALKEQ